MTSPMPTVARWAGDLRAAFGADDFNAGLRAQGYLAQEAGRTIDTRKVKLGEGIPLSRLVVGPPPAVAKKVGRG